jgi:hypothetical protein
LSIIKILPKSHLPSLGAESRPDEAFPVLRPGETLPGEVLKQIDPQHAVMRLKGQSVLVETQVPLPQQTELRFQVEETQPKVILRLLGEENLPEQPISFLLKYLPAHLPSEKIAENVSLLWKLDYSKIPLPLKNLLQNLVTQLKQSGLSNFADAKNLQQMIGQSGLFWENKLKGALENRNEDRFQKIFSEDLKGLLLRLRSQWQSLSMDLPAKDRSAIESFMRGVDQWLNRIELCQILNQMPGDFQENFFLFLPFWLENQLQFVELNLSYPKPDSESSQKDDFSVLFLLFFPALGKLRIDLRVKNKELFCQLNVTEPAVEKFLHQVLPDLFDRLQSLGYQPHIQVSVESLEKIQQSFLPEVGEGSQSLLSIRV